jgi:hypothetical protein
MEYGIFFIILILLFVAFVIVQETFAQLHWRGLVAGGDLSAIRELVDVEAERWRTSRVPRGTPALLWHGVQTVELLDVTQHGVRLSCNAEGEFALSNRRRVETSSPLAEGMKITMKLAEMALYDVPNVKLDHVQIDVYTSFRDEAGHAEPRCILSTHIERSRVETVDWDEISGADFVELNDGYFATGPDGAVHPIEPLTWAEEPAGST